MAENNNSQEQPLLLTVSSKHETFTKKSSPFRSPFKWVLKSLMWSIFSIWICVIFFNCTEFVGHLLQKWMDATEGTLFGITGSTFLVFSAPILIIAFLAFIYVSAFPKDDFETNKLKFPRYRLWTIPFLVEGPFGVVSASEFIGIVLFIFNVLGSIIYYKIDGTKLISKFSLPSKENSYLMMEYMGGRLGSMGILCTIFLFLPISRGSILLRLIDIPFEHATRYHVWLGHLTMFLFTLHGLFYVLAWELEGNLLENLVEWKETVANLPGVISLLAGLLMWATSLHPVRKNRFELFFYTHQLYIIFVVFMVMHIGDIIFSIAAGPIFLFIMDRFLRLCQSRTKVHLISASCRPCGTLELTFSKPANLSYNALSFIFVQVRELSFLQWHPFSVSSSPLDGKYHISVLVKVLGNWTEKLRETIENYNQNGNGNNSQKITACIEGPYGHESPYHLMYENLILVAGGIGISPFLAILSDILHRINEGKTCLPKNVMVIWAIKKSNESSLLSVIDSQSICPSFPQKIDLQIQTFVTQQSDPSLEEGKIENNNISFPSIFMKNGTSMSSLVGTGNNIFAGLYVILSTFGFITFFGLVQIYYFDKFGINQWWYRGLVFIGCMVGGVVLVGGIVVISWHLFERKFAKEENNFTDSCIETVLSCETGDTSLASVQTIHYGSRPNFEELFKEFSDKVGNANIGVIVCGPAGLQSSVAKECRSQNFNNRGRKNNAIFHFNSHSFDL